MIDGFSGDMPSNPRHPPPRVLAFEISKKTLSPGWAEIHIVARRPVDDSPDFDLMGEAARMKIAKTIVSMAAGIAHMFDDEKFEKLCVKFGRKHGLLP